MAAGYITVAPDAVPAGKSLQTFENNISSVDVHAEAVVLVDNTGTYISTLPVSLASNINIGSNVTVSGPITVQQSNASNFLATVSQGGTWNIGTITTAPNTNVTRFTGAANMFNGQVTATTTASTLAAARATRRSITIRNMDSSINAFIGLAVVSSSNGMLLKAGESISVDYTGLIQVVAGSNSPTVGYLETYD